MLQVLPYITQQQIIGSSSQLEQEGKGGKEGPKESEERGIEGRKEKKKRNLAECRKRKDK